jgi:demethylmenaquinone methyltransferase/2-methoxy-6-polyprenyl-1,4-benzoquinol methylase
MAKPNPGQPNQMAIRARYDFVARWHDAAGLFLMPHRRDAIRALNVQPGERVLDLACGTGINFKGIMTESGADGLLVGLDYSSGMLKQAHQRVKRYHWSNVALLLGDAARLPFADSVFDRVICTYSLKVIPSYRQALDEAARVLKPAGVFVVLDGRLSNGVTRFLNPLIQWMARGAMSDLARPLVEEIAQRFQDVRISEYDFGHTFVAVARRG